MPFGKRRRGKFSSRGSGTTTPPPQSTPPPEQPTAPAPSPKAVETSEKEEETNNDNNNSNNSNKDSNNDTKTKPEISSSATSNNGKASSSESSKPKQQQPPTPAAASTATAPDPNSDLVLTSEKRRGVYECDYCHSDISQLPRIRCATCADFDLCLDCFATTDHAAAVARLKAAATAHSELAADGIHSTMVAGISTAAANHRDTHGYKVCDSTRFPIFANTRNIVRTPKAVTETTTTTTAAAAGDKKEEEEREDADKTSTKETGEDNASEDKMDVDDADSDDKKSAESESKKDAEDSAATTSFSNVFVVNEDPKSIWTAEEDLRLLDAIKTHGLGNWGDISEAIGGNGSVGKTPRRCMERYFDDFLGRYGHILPAYTIVDDTGDDDNNTTSSNNNDDNSGDGEDEAVRASKRRHALMMRSSSNVSTTSSVGGRSRKRFKVVPTESLPEHTDLWPDPYIPPVAGVEAGQEVARDLSSKAELAFVKAISAAPSKEEAEKIRKEYLETKMNQIGSPTVLPPRPEDSEVLPGADLVGFMPRRGDFDIEWENEAESALADMEFLQGDSPQDKQLKVQVLEIYYQKQEEREKRKKFILSRNLFDYRQHVKKEQELPADERDLVHRMRLFERYHTPEEHKQFIEDIIKAKRLRKEIAKLQMYRRIGIRSLAEAEMYELDKKRRQFHKEAQLQKEAATKAAGQLKAAVPGATPAAKTETETPAASSSAPPSSGASAIKDSLWKQYRTTDRKVRKSINRAGTSTNVVSDNNNKDDKLTEKKEETTTTTTSTNEADTTEKAKDDEKEKAETKENDAAKAENGDDKGNDTADKQPGSESKAPEGEKTSEDANTDSKDKKEEESKDEEMKDAEQKDDDKKDDDKVASDDAKPKDDDKNTAEGTSSNKDGDKMDVDDEEEEFDITKSKGYDLLSRREIALCLRLQLCPTQYLDIKKALIQESLKNGLLESGNGRRTVVKIDVEKRGNVLDFMVRAGWISNKLASTARELQAPAAAE